MDDCICNPPVYRMDCKAHAWYFERMREIPPVCPNDLMMELHPAKEFYVEKGLPKSRLVSNRKMKRQAKRKARREKNGRTDNNI